MGISAGESSGAALPNVPVLRSDRGVGDVRASGEATPSVATAAVLNAPTPSREELQNFIRTYLDACQSAPVSDELAFYGGQVEYFDHGLVTRTYIRNELVAYNQQWPDRHYQMDDAISVSERGFETVARCRITFKLANPAQTREASGKTDNSFILARRPDLSWEILGHREERVRESKPRSGRSVRRRGKSRPAAGPGCRHHAPRREERPKVLPLGLILLEESLPRGGEPFFLDPIALRDRALLELRVIWPPQLRDYVRRGSQ